MDSIRKHIAFNHFLIAGNLLIICFFLVFFLWLEYSAKKQADAINNEPIKLNISQPESLNSISQTLQTKINIFDISGKHWTIPHKKKAPTTATANKTSRQYLKESEINGIMVLPSFSGIFVNEKFIPSGGKIKETKIQHIKGGNVQLETPDGTKTYKLQKKSGANINFFKKTTL